MFFHAYSKHDSWFSPYKSEVSHFDIRFLLSNVKRHHSFFLAYDRETVRHGSHKFIDTLKVKKRVRPACQKTLDVLPETDRTVDLANLIHMHLFCMGKYAQVLMLT